MGRFKMLMIYKNNLMKHSIKLSTFIYTIIYMMKQNIQKNNKFMILKKKNKLYQMIPGDYFNFNFKFDRCLSLYI